MRLTARFECKKENGMRNRKRVVLAFCMAVFLGIYAAGCSGEKAPVEQAEDRQGAGDVQAPENLQASGDLQTAGDAQPSENPLGELKSFEAVTLDGGTFTQEDLAQKDVTIINFWSVTCGPCVAEMPDIAEFAQDLPENVQVITVCLDGSRNRETAENILQDAGYEGVTLIAGDGDLLKVANEIIYTPTTIAADKDGNIVGDAIVGRQKNLAEAYTEAADAVLKSMGKEAIGNAGSGEP